MGDEDKDFDRRLRRARLAAFFQELGWKNYLAFAGAIAFLVVIVFAYHAKFGPFTLRGHTTGHELSNFVTPNQYSRSTFYMTVQLDDGRTVTVALPRWVEHQPGKRMNLSILERGVWVFRNEVVEFDSYIDPTTPVD